MSELLEIKAFTPATGWRAFVHDSDSTGKSHEIPVIGFFTVSRRYSDNVHQAVELFVWDSSSDSVESAKDLGYFEPLLILEPGKNFDHDAERELKERVRQKEAQNLKEAS